MSVACHSNLMIQRNTQTLVISVSTNCYYYYYYFAQWSNSFYIVVFVIFEDINFFKISIIVIVIVVIILLSTPTLINTPTRNNEGRASSAENGSGYLLPGPMLPPTNSFLLL